MITATSDLSLAHLESYDPSARAGNRERRFLCPLCGDSKARNASHRSLTLNVASGLWNCHRCGASGMLRDSRLPRQTARRRAVVASFRSQPAPVGKEMGISRGDDVWRAYWQAANRELGTEANSYLEGRHISCDEAVAANVRFSCDYFGRSSLLFPVRDAHNEVVAVAGRYLDALSPKSRSCGHRGLGVFATPGALRAPTIVLCEAPLDALSLAACGLPAIALCGTQAPRWLATATAFRPVALALDADEAGDTASTELAQTLSSFGARPVRWRPDNAKDWNELLVAGRDMPCSVCASRPTASYVAGSKHINGCWLCGQHQSDPGFYQASNEASPPVPPAPEGEADPGDGLDLAALPAQGRRCGICAHVLSVIAVRDICGRCASPHVEVPVEKKWSPEALLRGEALAELDKRGYPKVGLPDGRHQGPGLLQWAPVLRNMNAPELDALLAVINGMPLRVRVEQHEEADDLPW